LIDGITGALNEIPTDNDDDDDDDPNLQYEAWEVRELERIIVEWEVQVEKERNEEEQNQRRRRYAARDHWDDDEVDVSSSTNQKTNPMHQHGPSKTLAPLGGTGYHHRGAFFMEDTEGNEIRQKAMEYHTVDPSNHRTTAVYHDHQHRDRTQLPKVMQVKKFGFANQSKYRGLAAEDTTDKNLDILPIVHNNKNRSKQL
jgi:microfibrillar-associated protein 1